MSEQDLVDDNTLYRRYASGDFSAFEQLYARHKAGTFRFILRQLKNPQQTDDLFQQLWEKVINQAANYQPKAKFNTWLYTVARNLLIDNSRHLKVVEKNIKQSLGSEDTQAATPGPETLHEQKRADLALKYCLSKLPPAQLESFLLREEAALSSSEIAVTVGASVEATKSRLRSAIQNLRQCITLKLGKQVIS